jgi:hypothetical protein
MKHDALTFQTKLFRVGNETILSNSNHKFALHSKEPMRLQSGNKAYPTAKRLLGKDGGETA